MRYNVVRNSIRMVPNVPLASAPGKEVHPLILLILAIHGGQVKIEIYGIHTLLNQLLDYLPVHSCIHSIDVISNIY